MTSPEGWSIEEPKCWDDTSNDDLLSYTCEAGWTMKTRIFNQNSLGYKKVVKNGTEPILANEVRREDFRSNLDNLPGGAVQCLNIPGDWNVNVRTVKKHTFKFGIWIMCASDPPHFIVNKEPIELTNLSAVMHLNTASLPALFISIQRNKVLSIYGSVQLDQSPGK